MQRKRRRGGLTLDRYIETIVATRTIDAEPEHAMDEAQLSPDLQQGLEDIPAGRTRPAREVFDEFRTRHGIPR